MPAASIDIKRFRSRRDAEKILAEIIHDGGQEPEYRIDEDAEGAWITILEGDRVVGVLGA